MISIIIIEYHSLEDIESCITSIRRSGISETEVEIIISSNSCYPPEKREEILRKYTGLTWQFNSCNGGFAYAMNEGLKVARGEYLIIMNPDTRILSGFREMTHFLAVHPEIGAIGPQLIDKEGTIQDSCRKYITLPRFAMRNLKRILFHRALIHEKGIDYTLVQTADWIIGAFIMVKKEVYLRTSGLDTGYFLYCEDMDWCTRIRAEGYEVVYFPPMKVEYAGSRAARSSLKYTRIFLKSLLRYWNRFGYLTIRPKRRKLIYKYTP